MAAWLWASVRAGAKEKNILFLCFLFVFCLVLKYISSAPYKSFIVTDDMLYSSELGMTKGESMA